MISDQEFASSPPRSSDFFACGKPILRLRHLLPAPGVQTPNKKKSMLVYFMASPAINLPARAASTQHSSTAVSSISSRCPCSRRSSQPQPATTSQRCCQQQAGSTAGAALQMHASRIRSCAHQPHWLNQLANNRRSPPCCAQDKPRRPCCAQSTMRGLAEFLSLFSYFTPPIDWFSTNGLHPPSCCVLPTSN